MSIDIERLQIEKQQKKEELNMLIKELQTATQTGAHVSSGMPPERIDLKAQEAKLQAVDEIQTKLQEKKKIIETTLREIKEAMNSIKELEAKGLEKTELISAVKPLQAVILEKKEYMEKAVRDMETLRNKYAKYYGSR